MDQVLQFISNNWREIILPLIIFAITMVVGWFVRAIIFGQLAKWALKTETQIDDVIVESTKGPSFIWLLIAAIYFGIQISHLSETVQDISGKMLLVLIIISATLVGANLVSGIIRVSSTKGDSTLPVSSLTQNVSRALVYVVGLLFVLGAIGWNIVPVLGALGVGGLAVALALQDTLSNFFAGIYISVARQIRIGDYIKLESGQEGNVADIHWRTTTLKMLSNNIIIIPNSKLSNTIVTNYQLPEKDLSVPVELGIHYNSDLTKVEKITAEVAAEVMKEVPGGMPEFQPSVRYHTFGDSSIDFTVMLRCKSFVDQYAIKHEFVKRLHERYKKEGIVIPYPIRAINYDQEKVPVKEL
jgi:small-conductance mechanosensitive channel